MNIKNVQLIKVVGDDWEGFYINGKLVAEGHSIPWCEMMESLDAAGPAIFLDYWKILFANTEWLEDVGSLPDTLFDVSFAPDEIVPSCLIWGN